MLGYYLLINSLKFLERLVIKELITGLKNGWRVDE